MPEQHAYSTDSPEIVAAFRDTADAMRSYLPTLREAIAAIPGAKNPLVRGGFWGSSDELVALEADGSGDVPDGWRIVRGRLEPRRGKPGDDARKWLAAHQPPDVRHTLVDFGLPRHASIPAEGGRFRLVAPDLFEHDGTLWACYDGEPGHGVLDDGKSCTWTPRPLSEFYAAQETHEAARSAEAVPA